MMEKPDTRPASIGFPVKGFPVKGFPVKAKTTPPTNPLNIDLPMPIYERRPDMIKCQDD